MKKWKQWLSGLMACVLLCTLTAVPCRAVSVKFRDVPAGHWAASYITQAAEIGLVRGQTADTFGLGRPMTRAAFTVILCRLFGWEMLRPEKGSFTDVQDPALWYYSAVETACSNGAVTQQTSTFRPNAPITREEMAVMLIRALGYSSVAGLDQGLSCPFQDVDSNKGYLTMAYYLGISGGTSASTFSPDQTATREQAVSMLMRVYRCWHERAPERIGIAGSFDLESVSGCTAVALSSARLLPNNTVAPITASDEEIQTFREKLKASNARVLLQVSGNQSSLQQLNAADSAKAIAAEAVGYDGILLDIEKLDSSVKTSYTALVRKLRSLMGTEKLLYLVAEAPLSGSAAGGYDYAALSALADRLILRTAPYDKEVNGFPAVPQEPLEEVYYAFASLKNQVDPSKCSLWLSTTGLTWTGDRPSGSTMAPQIHSALENPAADVYYSARYADAYLILMEKAAGKNVRTVIWYHNNQAVSARVRLCAFFGADSVCLSNLASVADYPDYSITEALSGSVLPSA